MFIQEGNLKWTIAKNIICSWLAVSKFLLLKKNEKNKENKLVKYEKHQSIGMENSNSF